MKFLNGHDKGFHAAVRARANAYFRAKGIGPHGDWRVVLKGTVLVAAVVGLYAAILGDRLPGPAS